MKSEKADESKPKYDHDTPWHQIKVSPAKLQENLGAFRRLLERANPPKRIYEGMAGSGNQTRVLRELFPQVTTHRAWDHDEQCCEDLSAIEGVQVYHQDFFQAQPHLARCDLLVLDFNQFTLKHWPRHRPLFELGAGQVVVTDIAKGKVHLHAGAYGLEEGTLEAYIEQLARVVEIDTGLELVSYEPAPQSITYLLWRMP